jgi:hypothetical protein
MPSPIEMMVDQACGIAPQAIEAKSRLIQDLSIPMENLLLAVADAAEAWYETNHTLPTEMLRPVDKLLLDAVKLWLDAGGSCHPSK